MSYPTKLKLFKAWAKAMEEGATVDRPNYGKTTSPSIATSGRATGRKHNRKRLRKRKRKNAKAQD